MVYTKKELYNKQKEYFNKKLQKGRTSVERIQDNDVAQNLWILTQRSSQADLTVHFWLNLFWHLWIEFL